MIWKWIFLSTSIQALALQLESAPTLGLMQQPTSQYYHLVYGLHLTAATQKEGGILRYRFNERPVFKSQGFSDQDRLQMILIGGKVREILKKISIETLIGYGEISGYLKPTNSATTSKYTRRGYRLYGPAFDLQAGMSLGKRWKVAISHQTIVGLTSEEELKAYVSWPYAMYQVSIGVRM